MDEYTRPRTAPLTLVTAPSDTDDVIELRPPNATAMEIRNTLARIEAGIAETHDVTLAVTTRVDAIEKRIAPLPADSRPSDRWIVVLGGILGTTIGISLAVYLRAREQRRTQENRIDDLAQAIESLAMRPATYVDRRAVDVHPVIELTRWHPVAGPPGRDGIDGRGGRDGRDGIDGGAGRDGIDGRAGRDGAPGGAGRAGIDGRAGRDGAPGGVVGSTPSYPITPVGRSTRPSRRASPSPTAATAFAPAPELVAEIQKCRGGRSR